MDRGPAGSWWRTAAAVVVCGLAALTAGCGDDKPSPKTAKVTNTTASSTSNTSTSAPTTTTKPTTTTTSPPKTQPLPLILPKGLNPVEREVATAYRDAMSEYFYAARKPASSQRLLTRWFSGAALAQHRSRLQAFGHDGQALRPALPSRAALNVVGLSVAGSSARLRTCEIDDAVVFVERTGKVVNDTVGAYQARIDMSLIGGRWLVRDRVLAGKHEEGVKLCAPG